MNGPSRRLRALTLLSVLLTPVVSGELCLAADRSVDAAGDPLPRGIRLRMGSTRLWHRNLDKLRFTPDGKRLLSLGGEYKSPECMVWDVATGKLLKTLPGSAFPVAVSSDSRWWVSYVEGKLHLTKGLAGKSIHTIGLDKVQSATITHDNKTLVALTTDYRVCRWDLDTGKELSRRRFALVDGLKCADDPLARISPDGTLLVGVLHREWSRTQKTTPLHFWNTATGQEARPSLPVAGNYYDCRWTTGGRRFIVKTRQRNFEAWDLKTGKKLAKRKGSRNYNPEVTPNGKSELVSAHEQVSIYDLATGKYRWRQNVAPRIAGPGLKGAVVSRYAFSPDGTTAAIGSNCGRIVFIDWHTGKYVKGSTRQFGLYKEGYFGALIEEFSVKFSPDGSRLLVADAMSHEDSLLLCDARTGKELRRLKETEFLAWSPDGKRLAQLNWMTAENDDATYLQVTEAATGKEIWKIKMINADPSDVQFSADGRTITYRKDNAYHTLDADTGRSRRIFRIPPDEAKNASLTAISPNGKLVAVSAVRGEEAQVWDIDGKKIWSHKFPKNWKSWQARFLGNSRLALEASEKGVDSRVLHILDAATGRKHCEILTGGHYSNSILAAAPNGRTIAVKGFKDKRELRDAKTGRLIYGFEPRPARRHKLVFSPDGKWCAFNTDGHTIEVRDAATGKLVNRFHRPEHYVRHITFAPDSRTIALTFNDCTIWMWDAIKDQPKQKRR